MAGLLEKIKEMPQGNTIDLKEVVRNEKESIEQAAPDKKKEDMNDGSVSSHNDKDEKKEEKNDVAPHLEEDKEPAKDASQEQRDAYKQRKIKDADEKAKTEKERADRLSRELEDAKKNGEAWQRQAQQVKQAEIKPKDTQIDITKDPVGYLNNKLDDVSRKFQALETQQTVSSAQRELETMESVSETKFPDYKDVMEHAIKSEITKMKVISPQLSEAAIIDNFKAEKLKAAVHFVSQGRDPVEGLYTLAKAGYNYQPKQKAEDTKLTEKLRESEAEKARFDAVKKNKAKSGTGLVAGGSSSESVTPPPAKATMGEYAKMNKKQREEYWSAKSN